MGPVLAGLIVCRSASPRSPVFRRIAFLAIVILWRIAVWYKPQIKR